MKKNIIIFILGATAVIVLDQITKAAIVAKFFIHESYAVIDGFFNLVYVMNPGAAFGFLANISADIPLFFLYRDHRSGYFVDHLLRREKQTAKYAYGDISYPDLCRRCGKSY